MHLGFFASADRPVLLRVANSMKSSAAQIRALGNADSIRFHAFFLNPPRNELRMDGFQVTALLPLPAEVQCAHDGLAALAWRSGATYLFKPLLHWLLEFKLPSVRRLVLLDMDTLVVRELSSLWTLFEHFGSAVIGVANEQSQLPQLSFWASSSTLSGGICALQPRRRGT